MIETLLALALLAGIVAASASWTSIAGRVSTQSLEPLRREAAIEALFALIHDDLVSGDFDPDARRTGGRSSERPQRVHVRDGRLEIDGRAGTMHTYQFDRADHRLGRVEHRNGHPDSRTLLDSVSDCTLTLDDERRLLNVTIEITGREGSPNRWERRYRIP